MKTHNSMTRVTMRTRAMPGKHAAATRSAELPRLPGRQILVTGLLLGSVGVGSMAAAGHTTTQVNTHDAPSATRIINVPWMY
jgi:hypothetical protein